MQNVQKWIEESGVFKPAKKIGIGVSGGPDSMALLVFLHELAKKIGFHLLVINIDHSLRKTSAAESQFVKDFCKKEKVEFLHKKINVEELKKKQGWTTEQAARIGRYEAFAQVCKEKTLDYICLAHHKDDQAETVLMHIFRGSGLKGATGMEFVTESKIVRPFLNVTKSEIMEYVKINKIPYVIDESNKDERFTRNFIRTKILPQIKKVYPSVVDSLCLFAESCRADENFINNQVPRELFFENSKEIKILDKALEISRPLFVRLIKNAFEKIGVGADIEAKHIALIKEVFLMKAGSSIDLPHKTVAIRDYDGVTICKKTASEHTPTHHFVIGEVEVAKSKIKATVTNDPVFGEGNLFVDLAKIPVEATWRTKQSGDVFAKFGSGGTKKLSEYFTDKKILRRFRGIVPLLCVGNDVLVVAGEEISEHAKIDDQTETIIKLEFENLPQKQKTKEKKDEHKSSGSSL